MLVNVFKWGYKLMGEGWHKNGYAEKLVEKLLGLNCFYMRQYFLTFFNVMMNGQPCCSFNPLIASVVLT